jgi:hypothetical protein
MSDKSHVVVIGAVSKHECCTVIEYFVFGNALISGVVHEGIQHFTQVFAQEDPENAACMMAQAMFVRPELGFLRQKCIWVSTRRGS